MKATRLAFAAAVLAASLVPAVAREFQNDRFETTQPLPQVHPTADVRFSQMSEHIRSITDQEITAQVTFSQKGRATEVALQGTTGSERKDYEIRRMLLRTRFDLNPDEIGRPVAVVVKYRSS